MDKLEKWGMRLWWKVLLSPFLIVWWVITAGSLFADIGMKVTGAKPYRGGRR